MNWTIVLALVALIAAFIFYPAPSLSPNHLAWMNRGSYFKYNDYYIFYIGKIYDYNWHINYMYIYIHGNKFEQW